MSDRRLTDGSLLTASQKAGPKAGPEGVEDNYYVKGFKYKLVPKNKQGNYVQKGSGLEVKQLFEKN